MSADEIRYWLRELHEHHGWGWTHLSVALNAYDASTVKGKLKGKWIYPREQVRFSRQLDRIIAGELEPCMDGQRCTVRLAMSPKPIRATRMRYDVRTMKLILCDPRPVQHAKLRSFGELFKDAKHFEPTRCR